MHNSTSVSHFCYLALIYSGIVTVHNLQHTYICFGVNGAVWLKLYIYIYIYRYVYAYTRAHAREI